MATAASTSELTKVTFEPVAGGVVPPTRGTAHAVGFDLRAHIEGRSVKIFAGPDSGEVPATAQGIEIPPAHTALIPLGFRAEFAPPLEAQIRPRSSFGLRGLIVPNSPGTIDPDYRGEWMVAITNVSPVPQSIAHGERIAQAVFTTVHVVEWVPGTVSSTERLGGFGSTGK